MFWVFFVQKEEGLVKGQLNHSDLRQYINQMKNQITELKNEVGLGRKKRGPTHTHTHTRGAERVCDRCIMHLRQI